MRKGGCSLTVSGWLKVLVCGLLALVCCAVLSAPACQASDEMEAKQSFEVFKEAWLGKLNQHGEYGWEKIKVEQDSQDSCAARYKIITRATDSEVKATGDKLTPFVGILKYEEQTYSLPRQYVGAGQAGAVYMRKRGCDYRDFSLRQRQMALLEVSVSFWRCAFRH